MVAEYGDEFLFLSDGLGSFLLKDPGPPAIGGDMICGNAGLHAALTADAAVLPDNHGVMGFVRILFPGSADLERSSDVGDEGKNRAAG